MLRQSHSLGYQILFLLFEKNDPLWDFLVTQNEATAAWQIFLCQSPQHKFKTKYKSEKKKRVRAHVHHSHFATLCHTWPLVFLPKCPGNVVLLCLCPANSSWNWALFKKFPSFIKLLFYFIQFTISSEKFRK